MKAYEGVQAQFTHSRPWY